jgi:hypothetical protein
MAIVLDPADASKQLDALKGNPFREKIMWWAYMEAHPHPGKVSDYIPMTENGQRVRFGWQRLKQYFEEACNNVSSNYWKQKGQYKGAEITFLDGVRLYDMRVPQKDYNTGSWLGGVQWCGIFATWCWRQAGMNVKWMWPAPSGVKPRQDKTPQIGDIVILKGGLVHHFILINKQGDNGNWITVNGNSDYQSILVKPVDPKNVAYYYSVDDYKG